MRNWPVYVLASMVTLSVALLTMTSDAQIRTGTTAFGDWRTDAPGVQRHISPNDLPPPKSATEAEMADVRAGLRYCSGLTIQPGTGSLRCVVNVEP